MLQQNTTLIGIRPMTGSGKLDNGNDWKHDHVELHVITALNKNQGGIGQSVIIHKLQDCKKWFDQIKDFVGHEVILFLEQMTDGKGRSVYECTSVTKKK